MSDDDDDNKTPIDQLVEGVADLFVYAPIGLFFEGPSLLPKLARQGRVHANNARLFGQFAVKHGEAEVRRRVGDLEQQAAGLLKLLGLVEYEPGDGGQGAATAPAPASPVGADRLAPVSGNGHSPRAPDVADLAIPDYDSLSASQVVTRLDGLGAAELEAIRAYEAAHRGRKTILNKVAQLQA